MNYIQTDVIQSLQGLIFVLVAFGYMYGARLCMNATVGFDAVGAIERDGNTAVSWRRSGFYLAMGIGMYGAIAGPSIGFGTDLLTLLVDGFIVTGFLLIARWVNDQFVLHGIDNNSAVFNGNEAIGIVEFCGYLATGLIALGAFSGTGGSLVGTLALLALGQVVLVVITALYEWITKTEMIEEIRQNNRAAAVMVGGQMVAIGIILAGSLIGPTAGLVPDLMSFGWSAAKGIVLLFALEYVVDHVFLPNSRFEQQIVDKNTAAVFLGSAIRIGLAVVLVGAVV